MVVVKFDQEVNAGEHTSNVINVSLLLCSLNTIWLGIICVVLSQLLIFIEVLLSTQALCCLVSICLFICRLSV